MLKKLDMHLPAGAACNKIGIDIKLYLLIFMFGLYIHKKNLFFILVAIGCFFCLYNPIYREKITQKIVKPATYIVKNLSFIVSKKELPTIDNELMSYSKESDQSQLLDNQEPQVLKTQQQKTKATYSMGLYTEYQNITPENILSIINLERNKSKMRSLGFDHELVISAQKKADDMLKKSYFSHTTPDGKDFTYFIDYAGYEFMRVSENLAQGDFYSSRDVVLAWMNSSNHKANIFDSSMTDTGIGISFGTYKGRQGYFIVQHFGRPRGACPLVDVSLEPEIKNLTERGKRLYEEIKKSQKQIDDILNNNPDAAKRETAQSIEKSVALKISEYNAVVDTLQELTIKYNIQVKSFNDCNINSRT